MSKHPRGSAGTSMNVERRPRAKRKRKRSPQARAKAAHLSVQRELARNRAIAALAGEQATLKDEYLRRQAQQARASAPKRSPATHAPLSP